MDELQNARPIHGAWESVAKVADDKGVVDTEVKAAVVRAHNHDIHLVTVLGVERLEEKFYAGPQCENQGVLPDIENSVIGLPSVEERNEIRRV